MDRLWEFAPKQTADEYLAECRNLARSPEEFSQFRRNRIYGKILEGGNREVGVGNLRRLKYLGASDWLKSNLERFRENDKVGNPYLYEFDELGYVSPSLLQYALNAFEITQLLPTHSPVSIVEIGGGYGGLCRILDCIYQFRSYVLIDEPDALTVAKLFLSHWPETASRVSYVSCHNTDGIASIGNVDLVIACSSLAECSSRTQMFYNDVLLHRANAFYLVYNTLHLGVARTVFRKLNQSWRRNFRVSVQNPWDRILHVSAHRTTKSLVVIWCETLVGYSSPIRSVIRYLRALSSRFSDSIRTWRDTQSTELS